MHTFIMINALICINIYVITCINSMLSHGQGCNLPLDEDQEKNFFDKSAIQCYNCQKYGHFAYECRSNKKEQDDQACVSESTSAAAIATSSALAVATSSLLMVEVEGASDLLLHGSEGALSNPTLWYLDTRATNHITSRQTFFYDLDEFAYAFFKFGDNLKI